MAYTRLFDILPHQLQNHPKADCLAYKQNGTWKKFSTAETVAIIQQLSKGLYALGCRTNRNDELKDKVALISNNRPEWNFLDNALLRIGVVNVPIYPTITDEEMQYIFNDAGIKYAFVSDEALYKKVVALKAHVPTLLEVYTFNPVAGAKHYDEVLQLGASVGDETVNQIADQIVPEDLATIIYTSGTTGKPKGVMLSHHNIISNLEACVPILLVPLNDQHRALSFLPLCHIFERMVSYLLMTSGISIYYAESMDTIGDNIKEIHPHVFTTVPRLLEKVYDRIVATGSQLTGIKKALFFWALNLGLRYDHDGANGAWYNFQLSIADKLIFKKWREALGNEVKIIVSGGAALQPRLARVFTAAGVRVLEGYGLTETSPVVAVNRPIPHGSCFTTVGPIIDNIQLKFEADGEICIKGPSIMKGYYKRDDLTKEVIDADGFFHTGDIGEWVQDKYLKITDRKKELFKTSGGKYVAPQVIENKLKESAYIEQIMIIGNGMKYVSALIVPAFAALKTWSVAQKINCNTNEELIKHPQVLALFNKIVNDMNATFNHVEQIKRFELLAHEWTIQSGELTPTLKLKRKILLERNAALIDAMYAKAEA